MCGTLRIEKSPSGIGKIASTLQDTVAVFHHNPGLYNSGILGFHQHEKMSLLA